MLTKAELEVREVAKRVAACMWSDEEMGTIAMDVEAALAKIIDDVRRNDKQCYDELLRAHQIGSITG